MVPSKPAEPPITSEQRPEAKVELRLSLKRILTSPDLPKSFNKLLFTAVEGEVVLDVGYIDLRDLFDLTRAARAGQLEPETSSELPYFVTDRFSISPSAAVELLITAQKIVAHFRGRGLIPDNEIDAAFLPSTLAL